jgi:L-seryl-tRNA(Ser) seleniumtransferase
MRALRVGKLTLAALSATLQLHLDRDVAERSVPVLSLLTTPVANLQNRAERLAPQLAACSLIADAEPLASTAYLGGGSVPGQELPTWCVALRPARGSVEGLATTLRTTVPAVFGRIQKDRLLLDLRSVFPRQDLLLVEAVQRAGGAAEAAVAGDSPEAT